MTRKRREPVQELAVRAFDKRMGEARNITRPNVTDLTFRTGIAQESPHRGRQIRKSINPRRIRPWKYADRSPNEMEHLRELAKSMREDGQYQHIIVRPLADEDSGSEHDYEVIAGNVRWQSAIEAGLESVDCIIKQVDDATAMRIMVAENELRRNISPLSRAKSLHKAIGRDGIYADNAEAARALKLSEAQVSRYMRIAAIPETVLQAFEKPHAISLRLAIALSQGVADGYEADLVDLAPSIEAGEISAATLPRVLLASATREDNASGQLADEANGDINPRPNRCVAHPRIYATRAGRTFLTFQRSRKGAALRIPADIERELGTDAVEQLVEEIASIIRKRFIPE